MLVFNDFVKEEHNKQLLQLLESVEFPWYYQKQAHTVHDPLSILSIGFSHVFVNNGEQTSDMLYVLEPLIDALESKLGALQLLRAQANLLLNHKTEYIGTIHTDGFNGFETGNSTWVSAVYYVNDSNGDTVFFDKDGFEWNRVSPEKNKIVMFRGKQPHAASLPTNYPTRLVININCLVIGDLQCSLDSVH